jgi:hypothetical protein
MIKVFEYQNSSWGIVFKKIGAYLRKYAPSDFKFVDSIDDSDIQIIHVVGLGEIEWILKSKNPVIFQHCFLTAGSYTWDELWENSLFIASFYNLREYTNKTFNFLYTSLGYDENIFKTQKSFYERERAVFTTGHVAETECLDLIYQACKEAGYVMYHTGENFKFGGYYHHLNYLSEFEYAALLQNVRYVFGLRKIEGFEVAVLEGIASGAVGVVPTLSSYNWYNELAIRVDVNSPELVKNLYNILRNEEKIVINQQKLSSYSWSKVFTNFWNYLCQLLKK